MSETRPDERPATWEHIHTVQVLLLQVLADLQGRIVTHDQSKLRDPERRMFDEATSKLRGLTYGSAEYVEQLQAMGPALRHHYDHNRHHPEHYAGGVDDMTLVDVLEMVVDWKAATTRHADGNIGKSLEINRERFFLAPQLVRIMENTVRRYGWDQSDPQRPVTQREDSDG